MPQICPQRSHHTDAVDATTNGPRVDSPIHESASNATRHEIHEAHGPTSAVQVDSQGRGSNADSAWESASLAAILDLLEKMGRSADVKSACLTIATEVAGYMQATRIVVGMRNRSKSSCRLAAVSGMANIDPQSETAKCFEAVLDLAVLRNRVTTWPLADNPDRYSAMTDQALSAIPGNHAMISSPLIDGEGKIIGAWALFGSEAFAASPYNRSFVEVGSRSIGGCLALIEKAQPGRFRRTLRRIAHAVPFLRGKRLWLAGAAVLVAMFVSMPYRVNVDCDLQPVVRRFVAAPFAGPFEKSLIKPGDLVSRGQLLGRMDGREVRWELAGLTADEERASKSRDVNMAEGKTAAAQMDLLEMQRLDSKRKFLETRLDHLEIRSPINGVIVSGDLQRSEGVPVTVGQVLFEVAPLDRMVAELAIADEDITRAKTDMHASIHLDGCPTADWSGDIARIHPRSITREKDNVFIAEVALDNSGLTLRPGMKGRATLHAGTAPLGWILFHKPWDYVVSRLGW